MFIKIFNVPSIYSCAKFPSLGINREIKFESKKTIKIVELNVRYLYTIYTIFFSIHKYIKFSKCLHLLICIILY